MDKIVDHQVLSKDHTELDSTLHQIIQYPPHPPRAADSKFTKIRHQRVVVNNQPCFICGITNHDIHNNNPDPSRFKQMELHHCLVQWALADGIDVDKWNAQIVPLLNSKSSLLLAPSARSQDISKMSREQIIDFAHHGDENLLVLCNVHHRSPLTGIHKISYPAWISQKYLKPQYIVDRPATDHFQIEH